jgi:tRNA(fMet)-specific endonuclease VapC
MTYFLDSNICIRYLNGTSESVTRRLNTTNLDEVRIPSIVAAELLYGASKSAKRDYNLSRFRLFLTQFVIIKD